MTLSEARQARGISQADLNKMVGSTSVPKWEQGVIKMKSCNAVKIANALNATISVNQDGSFNFELK